MKLNGISFEKLPFKERHIGSQQEEPEETDADVS